MWLLRLPQSSHQSISLRSRPSQPMKNNSLWSRTLITRNWIRLEVTWTRHCRGLLLMIRRYLRFKGSLRILQRSRQWWITSKCIRPRSKSLHYQRRQCLSTLTTWRRSCQSQLVVQMPSREIMRAWVAQIFHITVRALGVGRKISLASRPCWQLSI